MPASQEASQPAETEGELGGNPTPGGTVPDTALGSTTVPAWPFALLFLGSLAGLAYMRLSTEANRTR